MEDMTTKEATRTVTVEHEQGKTKFILKESIAKALLTVLFEVNNEGMSNHPNEK